LENRFAFPPAAVTGLGTVVTVGEQTGGGVVDGGVVDVQLIVTSSAAGPACVVKLAQFGSV